MPPNDAALDALFNLGYVHVPLLLSPDQSWPEQMFACNIAKGFSLIAINASRDANLHMRFSWVFLGVPFKRATAYCNFNTWRLSTKDEQHGLLALPWMEAGLWKEVQEHLSEWAKSR